MARPKKIIKAAEADQLTDKLTKEDIELELMEFEDDDFKLTLTDSVFTLRKGKLSVCSNLSVPIECVKQAAEYLASQANYVRMANRRDKQGRRAIGDIIDKSGDDITNQR